MSNVIRQTYRAKATESIRTVSTVITPSHGSFTIPVAGQGEPYFTFYEARLTTDVDTGEQLYTGNEGSVSEVFNDQNTDEVFELKNEAGDVIGAMTYEEFATALLSLYEHAAAKRDDLDAIRKEDEEFEFGDPTIMPPDLP
jgi:hypothetical protein